MIQVLDRAIRVLVLLGENSGKILSLSEIADTLSLDRGTTSRILKSLAERGFVQQEAPRSGYQLGYRLYHITGHLVENSELTKIARKDVEALGAALNETALLAIARNDMRVVLYNTVPERSLVVRTKMEMPIFSVCAGRVILANYTPAHLEKCIIRLGLPDRDVWPEIYQSAHPRQELFNTLTEIKRRGYDVLDDGHGITGFAAPLFMDGHVKGSIGTYLPTERIKDEKTIIDAVMYYAGEINQKLKTVSTLNK